MALPNPFDLRYQRSGPDGDLVEQFLSTFGNRQTRRNYRTDLRQFLGEDEVTRQQASRVEENDISEFLRGRADSMKRKTLKRKLEAIRSFFRWLAGQNMIEELPIREELGTGDLVDQVVQEAHSATERSEDSRSTKESVRKDQGDSDLSRRGPVPMELEPGSEVDFGRETDSSSGKSSSPSSRPDVGEGAGETPGSECTESSSSGTPTREKRQSGESSNGCSTGSDTASAEEGPSEEESVEERDTREDPVGEEATEENSADEDSTGEDPDGKDRHSIPDWAVPSGSAQEIDLRSGRNVALADLPDVLVGALRKLDEPGGPEGLCIRCTNDLKVQIRPRRDEDSQIIEASIEHYVLQRKLRDEGDLSEEALLRQAIIYLHGLDWDLPVTVYDHVGALPDPGDVEGAFSEEHPRWRQEGAENQSVRVVFAAQVTGALAEGFGIEKDEEVFVGI